LDRLVFLSDFHPNDESAFITGSHLQVYQIAKLLSEYRESHLLVSTNDQNKVGKVIKEGGLFVHYLRNPRFEILKIPIFLKRVFELEPTLVFQRGRSALTVVGFLSKVLLSSTFIWSSNAQEGLDFLKYTRFLSRKGKIRAIFGLLLDFLINISLEGADLLVAQNEEQRGKAEKRFWWKKIRMCKNLQEIPEKLEKFEKPTVIWVGRLDENKNPKIFVDLAKEFPECEFLMVGYGNEELIRDRPGNLKFFGKLPREETLRLISSSWVLVNTSNSESEGIPNVILEAMLCGTPVLSLNVRVEGIAYEVFCGDIKVLIERLRDLLSSREKVLNLGEKLRREALGVFVEESRECWLRVILSDQKTM